MNKATTSQTNWLSIVQVSLASFVLLVGGFFASFDEYKRYPDWVDPSVFPVVWAFLNSSHILLLVATLIEDNFGLSIFGLGEQSYFAKFPRASYRWLIGIFSILTSIFLGAILVLNWANYAWYKIIALAAILLTYLLIGFALFLNLDIGNDSDISDSTFDVDGRCVVRNLLFMSATFNLLYTVFVGAFEKNHALIPEETKAIIIVVMALLVFITIMLGWEYKFITTDWKRWIGFGLWLLVALGVFGMILVKVCKANQSINLVSKFAFSVVLGLIISAVVLAATKKEMPMWILHTGLFVWLTAGALPLQIQSIRKHAVPSVTQPA